MPNVPLIKMEDCKDGWLYFIEARNGQIGIYNKESLGFIISRTKFTANFLDTEYHYDIGTVKPDMEHYGTATPLKEVVLVPQMTDVEKLKYLNEQWALLKDERMTYHCSEPKCWYSTPEDAKQGKSFIDWDKYNKDKAAGKVGKISDYKVQLDKLEEVEKPRKINMQ